MKAGFALTACLVAFALPAPAADRVSIAETWRRIVADHQQVRSEATSLAGLEAANRLALDAYRHLLSQAEKVKDPGADDLHALGACHEALDEREKALAHYHKALEKRASADTHLALARLMLARDLAAALTHFKEAVRLQPGHPVLGSFQQDLGDAHQRRGQWAEAVPFFEAYLAHTKSLLDRRPGSASLRERHANAGKQLDRVRRYAAMTNHAAPGLDVTDWIQGPPATPEGLKGKVVVIDFFAVWSAPSRKRLDLVKRLHERHGKDGLEVLSVGLAYQYRYDAEKDQAEHVKDLPLSGEREGLQAFAKKHGIKHRLGFVAEAVVDEYGVVLLPHTVVVDARGNVQLIQLVDDQAEKRLDETVRGLLRAR
jgi:tetratricopeptide (TPR) repeat protein